ncbi:YcdB/YcdC domain-containing protein [Lysinibacillus sp. SGAir0095]|uniref:YcdB/YcdC domain-containing protein n=1 Tax=Lysinibacillus sp. SGAir0095 TaxID=2070463 RepID=UPI00351A3FCC
MFFLNKEQLQERAKSLVQLPKYFQPVIEEYFGDENGEGEAIFTWSDEQQEEGISVTLDLAGNLISLSVELNRTDSNTDFLNASELEAQARAFLDRHYPHALQNLTLYETKKLTTAYRFYYEQIVMDLPLPHAGCFIDVEPGGEIVNFKYYGIQPKPIIPKSMIEKEKLIDHVQNRMDFQMTIANLNPELHDIDEGGLHLVYDVDLFMEYQTDTVEPTLTIVHEEDIPSKYSSLPTPTDQVKKESSIEVSIGITEDMEVIREVDLGGETGIVWRSKEWKLDETDLSMNSFLQRHNEDTVKAFISKKTGKVRSFMWFKERSGDLCLNRENCYQIAIDFIQMIALDDYRFLQLIVNENDDELDEDKMNEVFTFQVHNGQGIRIYLERVRVSVNRQTGLIDYYSGPSFDFEKLKSIPSEPVITQNKAHEIFLSSLDFELAWSKSYEEDNGEYYMLVYQACERDKRKAIRYIDALTGAVITEKG